MTKSFTERQLDAIADFNWGSTAPPRRNRSTTGEVAAGVLGKVDGKAQATDSAQADSVALTNDLDWH